jgi:hypothetical protein
MKKTCIDCPACLFGVVLSVEHRDDRNGSAAIGPGGGGEAPPKHAADSDLHRSWYDQTRTQSASRPAAYVSDPIPSVPVFAVPALKGL